MKEKIAAGPTPIRADGQALTSAGESSEGSFSPDGQKIVYVSANRKRHRLGQIYELDLRNKKERRITFQSAAVHGPQYSPKGDSILYSSGTDEMKEDPPLLHDKKADAEFTGPAIYLERTDLYLHHLPGLQMERLLRHPGFDGEAKFAGHNTLIFTRREKADLGIFEKTLKGNSAHAVKGAGLRSAQPASALDGKRLAWIEYAADFKISSLKVKDGREIISLLDDVSAIKKDPIWAPDGEMILFSMNYPDAKAFEIYLVKRDGRCLTPLTQDHVVSEQPAVSPSQDAFLFTSNQRGARQIYIKAFPKTLNCPLSPELIEKTP
jgi:Tol biopolymer transport system component